MPLIQRRNQGIVAYCGSGRQHPFSQCRLVCNLLLQRAQLAQRGLTSVLDILLISCGLALFASFLLFLEALGCFNLLALLLLLTDASAGLQPRANGLSERA